MLTLRSWHISHRLDTFPAVRVADSHPAVPSFYASTLLRSRLVRLTRLLQYKFFLIICLLFCAHKRKLNTRKCNVACVPAAEPLTQAL